MRFLIAAFVLTLIVGLVVTLHMVAPAFAEPHSARLRALLAEFPDPGSDARLEIEFSDLAAARKHRLFEADGTALEPGALSGRAMPQSLQMLALSDDAGMRQAVGFSLADVGQMAVLLAPPARAMIVDLYPGAGAAVPAALDGAGYAETVQGGVTAWARGQDLRPDFDAIDQTDPFGAGLGMASRVQLADDRLLQASAWSLLSAMTAPGTPRLADAPLVSPLLDALDHVETNERLVAATIWTDARSLGALDPALLLGQQIDPQVTAPEWPHFDMPALTWRSALFADFTDGPTSTGVLVLTVALPDAVMAAPLAERIATNWSSRPSALSGQSFAEMTGAEAEIRVEAADGEYWVVTLAATGATEPAGFRSYGHVFRRLYEGALSNDLVFLNL